MLSVGLMAVGMLAAAPRAAHAQNVWVFDQMDTTPLKPCFRVGKGDWVDFGGIGPQGQFAWGDFIDIAKGALGADPNATQVLVRFTWASFNAPGPITCPSVSDEPNGKTVFMVDGKTPVYIFVGGAEEVRKVVPSKQEDPGHDQN